MPHPSPIHAEDHPLRGGLLALAASACFAGMGVVVRIAGQELPNEVVVFFRNLFGLAFLLPWLVRNGLPGLATRRPGTHLLRGLAGLSAMYCFFYALGRLPLAEAVLLNYAAPLFIPLFARLWLGERLHPQVALAIVIGFSGIVLVLHPGTLRLEAAAWIGLASGVLAALAMTGVRALGRSEPSARIVFYFGAIASLVSAVPLSWAWQSPRPALLWLLLGGGLLATLGQLLLTRAYALAPAAQVGPLTYASVVFAAGFGWLGWSELPDAWTLTGASLVILAGSLAIRAGRGRRRVLRARHD